MKPNIERKELSRTDLELAWLESYNDSESYLIENPLNSNRFKSICKFLGFDTTGLFEENNKTKNEEPTNG